MGAIDGTRDTSVSPAGDGRTSRGLGRWSLLSVSVGLVVVGAAVGLWPLLELVHHGWTERYGHFEHGYLVLALAVWLAVRYWRRVPPQELAPAWWALVPLVASIAALGLLELMFINSTRLALLPLLFIAGVALVLGRAAATQLFLPAMFVYFALPQWWAINGVMQSLTTAMVTRMVDWTGLPAFIEGNFVHVPAGIFEIASGCSGLNYLLVGLTLGGFYALMYLQRRVHQAVLLAVAIALALVSNWIRVYSLILIGHLSDMQHYLIVVEHHTFGWVLFLGLMAPMLLVARQLEDREKVAMGLSSASSAPRPEVPGESNSERRGPTFGRSAPRVSPSVLAAALLAALLFLTPRAFDGGLSDGSQAPAPLPATLAGHQSVERPSAHWRPVFLNAASDHAGFDDGQGVIEIYRAAYLRQDRDHRLVRRENDFLGDGFRRTEQVEIEVDTPGGPITVRSSRGTLAGEDRLIWSWYWVAGRPAATPLDAKLAEFRGLLDGRRDGLAVALSVPCRSDCAAVEERLADFLAGAAAALQLLPVSDGGELTDDSR